MRTIILTFICLFSVSSIYAQVLTDTIKMQPDSLDSKFLKASIGAESPYQVNIPKLIRESPQVAGFRRYGEYPISPATGVPQIEIPLYEIKVNDITVPISISYHASGIKVEDIATPVGLGWTLNTGGVITASVKNVVDKAGYTNNGLTSTQDVEKKMKDPRYQSSSLWEDYLSGKSANDTQSDRYVYNFNGNSGVFRYNSLTNELTTIPYAPLIVTLTTAGFKITDTDGLIYYFEKLEEVISGMTSTSRSWYLTKIESQLTGTIVNYKYKAGTNYTEYVTTQIASKGISYEFDLEKGPGSYETKEITQAGTAEYQRELVSYSPLLLEEITWNTNKIKLNYKTDRLDKYKDRLETITVETESAVVKNITLNNKSYWGNNEKNYRMRLDDIRVNGEKYMFTYNNLALPDYKNFSSTVTGIRCRDDYWGYYTGRESMDFIPSEYNNIGSYSANRNPSEYHMQACILNKITYPTGGYTEFTYEANRVPYAYSYVQGAAESIVGGLRVKSIISAIETSGAKTQKTYRYSGHATNKIEPNMFQYQQYKIYSVSYYQFKKYIELWDFNVSEPLTSITGWSSSPVFYDSVTEYYGTESVNIGKKITTYSENIRDLKNSYGNNVLDTDIPRYYSAFKNIDQGLMNPLIQSEYIYKNGNDITPIKSTRYYYKAVDKGKIICGVDINQRDIWANHSGNPRDYPYTSIEEYLKNIVYYDIEAFRHFYLLSDVYTTEYHSNGNITTSTTYKYDDQYRLLSPIIITMGNSNGVSIIEEFKHPFNYESAVYTEMVTKNIISPIIYKKKTTGSSVIAVQNDYKKDTFKKENVDISRYVIDNIKSGTGSNLETRIIVHSYDKYGNPIYVTQDEVTNIVYIWDETGQYPIAEIKNSTYTEAMNAIQAINAGKVTAERIDAARTRLPSAHITTYEYQPLVGITKMTDPRGIVTTYEYDSYGRLIATFLIDEKGVKQSLQDYKYNYKNQ